MDLIISCVVFCGKKIGLGWAGLRRGEILGKLVATWVIAEFFFGITFLQLKLLKLLYCSVEIEAQSKFMVICLNSAGC